MLLTAMHHLNVNCGCALFKTFWKVFASMNLHILCTSIIYACMFAYQAQLSYAHTLSNFFESLSPWPSRCEAACEWSFSPNAVTHHIEKLNNSLQNTVPTEILFSFIIWSHSSLMYSSNACFIQPSKRHYLFSTHRLFQKERTVSNVQNLIWLVPPNFIAFMAVFRSSAAVPLAAIASALTLCLWSAVMPAADALKVNATLDPCATSDDCRLGLLCLRPQGDSATICYGFNNKKPGCKCLPTAPVTCTSTSHNCPPGEGCALSRVSGNTFCVSCNIIFDSNSNYTAVNGDPVCVTSPTPLPTPSKSPAPPRARFDLCSDDDPCRAPLVCASLDGDLCSYGEPPCFCVQKNKQKTCVSPKGCSEPDETCVRYTSDNSTLCASCSTLKTHPDYIPQDPEDTKCNSVPLTKNPVYIPSDGLANDYCFSDKQCLNPYRCLSAPNTLCTKKDLLCLCQSYENGPQKCTQSSQCRAGELCARRRQTTQSECMSIALYLQSAAGIFQVFGSFPQRGNKQTYEFCRMNYDCASGLYCSHLSEDQIGGCFGRKSCTCVPPQPEQCASPADCRDHEACAKIPDAQQEPICYSRRALWKDPYYRKLSKANAKPTPTILPTDGWTEDSCSVNADCKQDVPRICQHFSESKGTCNRRRMCVCRTKKKIDSKCTSSKQCSAGEICVVVKNSRLYTKGSCKSRKLMNFKAYAKIYVEKGDGLRTSLPSASPDLWSNDILSGTVYSRLPLSANSGHGERREIPPISDGNNLQYAQRKKYKKPHVEMYPSNIVLNSCVEIQWDSTITLSSWDLSWIWVNLPWRGQVLTVTVILVCWFRCLSDILRV